MTKLMEWLLGLGTFMSIWGALVTHQVECQVVEDYRHIVMWLPLILLFLFGVYSATVVLWRVYTFNNCEEAAQELQQQIEEAKQELTRKGFKFASET